MSLSAFNIFSLFSILSVALQWTKNLSPLYLKIVCTIKNFVDIEPVGLERKMMHINDYNIFSLFCYYRPLREDMIPKVYQVEHVLG